MPDFQEQIATSLRMLENNRPLLDAAREFHSQAMKAGIKDAGAFILELPLSIPQAAYFVELGYRRGLAEGERKMRFAMEQALTKAAGS